MPKSVSQSICHPRETETHPSSHDTWFIYRSLSTWFPWENVFICCGVMDRTMLHANDSQTDKSPWSKPVSVSFLFEFGFSESLREVHQLICISHTLRRDCFRCNFFFLSKPRIVAFTWSHLFSEFSEREEVQMVSEQCETHHSPWKKQTKNSWMRKWIIIVTEELLHKVEVVVYTTDYSNRNSML